MSDMSFHIKMIMSFFAGVWNAINAFIHYMSLMKNDFSLKRNYFSLKKNDSSLRKNNFSLNRNSE